MRALAIVLWAGSLAWGGELKGYISDAACGWNNARNTKEAKECVRACLKNGFDPVFILDGDMNTYTVSDKAKVLPFAGEHVAITGRMQGNKVIVEEVRKLDEK